MKAFTIIGGLVLLIVAGCASRPFHPLVVEKIGSAYQVTSNSRVMNNHIRLTERSVERNVNDIMIAQLRGQNISNRDFHFEYRFLWLDERGMVMSGRTSDWRQGRVVARHAMFLQATAPSPQAVDFLCEVRFRRDGARW